MNDPSSWARNSQQIDAVRATSPEGFLVCITFESKTTGNVLRVGLPPRQSDVAIVVRYPSKSPPGKGSFW
eukprot:9476774-Pyramimonas_sp.AAC.1